MSNCFFDQQMLQIKRENLRKTSNQEMKMTTCVYLSLNLNINLNLFVIVRLFCGIFLFDLWRDILKVWLLLFFSKSLHTITCHTSFTGGSDSSSFLMFIVDGFIHSDMCSLLILFFTEYEWMCVGKSGKDFIKVEYLWLYGCSSMS